mgnify:CR=1 FL=1
MARSTYAARLAGRALPQLDRIRVLDRCQQPTNPTAIWARKDLHPKDPPQQLRPRVVAPNCATPLAWTMRHPHYRLGNSPRSNLRRPPFLRIRAGLVEPFRFAILSNLRNVVDPADSHPVQAPRDTSPSAAGVAAPKPAAAQSAPAAPSLHASSHPARSSSANTQPAHPAAISADSPRSACLGYGHCAALGMAAKNNRKSVPPYCY